MLRDWEASNKPQSFSDVWNKKYKVEAYEVIQEFVAFLSDLKIQ